MLQKVIDLTSHEAKGLNTNPNIFTLTKDQSPNMMNVRVDTDGSWVKRLGTSTMNALVIADSGPSGFSPTGAITTNLIAFWKMDEPSGTRLDSISTHHLGDFNTVTQAGGIKAAAGSYVSANSEMLYIANTAGIQTGNIDFSMSTWFYVNATSTTVQKTLIAKRSEAGGISSNLCTAGTPSASNARGSTPASNAFDGDISTEWQTDVGITSATLQYDYGVSVFHPVIRYTIGLDSDDTFGPNAWTFEGSNDGSAWTVLDTQTAQTWSVPETKTYNFSNSTSYRYIRLNITANNGGNSIIIGELQTFKNTGGSDEFEYWLYVNTDNILTFRVSSSGTADNGSVRATSFGAITTATWYNAVAYHDAANDLIAVGINLSMNSGAYTSGVRAGTAAFVIGNVSNNTLKGFDGRIDETGFWKKVLDTTDRANLYSSGSSNTFQTAFGRDPWASFDFGASNIRWLIVSAATGIYASSNLGVTWVTIATDRTANYQYFERSKNVLVSGSDSYDVPLMWPGSAGTFTTMISTSAPSVKYWVNHQGFLIGLNTSARKRGFYYEDENTQVTGDWADSFDLPSTNDDEITNGFVLRRRLYVSTRYLLYGLDYVGGNPDWSYRKIKDFGFVPRTVRTVTIEGIGEVAVGLDWGNKLRIFDGADDKIISEQIQLDNGICEFALSKVSNAGSGKVVSFANVDRNNAFYSLCLSIGANSTQTTHFINYNGRNNSFWPYDNMPFNTMTSAESNNTSYTMAFDRSGRVHMLDSGNKDAGVNPVNDILDSVPLFDKSPSQAQKNHSLDLVFQNNTAGRIYVKENVNMARTFTDRD